MLCVAQDDKMNRLNTMAAIVQTVEDCPAMVFLRANDSQTGSAA